MLWKIAAAAAAFCLAATPLAAQQSPPPVPSGEEQPQRGNMTGEAWGYLALPILLVLTALIGFAIGGDEEEGRASP